MTHVTCDACGNPLLEKGTRVDVRTFADGMVMGAGANFLLDICVRCGHAIDWKTIGRWMMDAVLAKVREGSRGQAVDAGEGGANAGAGDKGR